MLNIHQTPLCQFGGNITNDNTCWANSLPVGCAAKHCRLLTSFEFEVGSQKSRTDRLEEAINRLQSEIRDSLDIQRDILLAMLEILRVKKPKVKFVLSHWRITMYKDVLLHTCKTVIVERKTTFSVLFVIVNSVCDHQVKYSEGTYRKVVVCTGSSL